MKQAKVLTDAEMKRLLAETVNGLYKAEVIHRRGPWRSFEAVELATLEWVDWFNNRRLLEPIGNIPRPKLRNATTPCSSSQTWRRDSNKMASAKPGAVHIGKPDHSVGAGHQRPGSH